jgi:hypothetical protein
VSTGLIWIALTRPHRRRPPRHRHRKTTGAAVPRRRPDADARLQRLLGLVTFTPSATRSCSRSPSHASRDHPPHAARLVGGLPIVHAVIRVSKITRSPIPRLLRAIGRSVRIDPRTRAGGSQSTHLGLRDKVAGRWIEQRRSRPLFVIDVSVNTQTFSPADDAASYDSPRYLVAQRSGRCAQLGWPRPRGESRWFRN